MAGNPDLVPIDSKRAAEIGALGGAAKKGSKHLSTLIRDIGNNIDWDKTNLKNKTELREKYGKNAWVAITYVAMTKAMAGDDKAMKWLAENGYGKNIKLDVSIDPVDKILEGMGLKNDGQDQGTAEASPETNT